MFCARIPTPLDIASSTFMILDKGGIPRAELSPNDQLTFLSTIPDLSKTDNLSQIIISGLFEAIELAIRENLGGCNYLTIPAGTRMLLLYPIEVNIEPKHVEPFIIIVDSPAYLVNPVSSLFERRRIEATVNRFKIQYTQGFYSVQKDASYQKCLFSLIKRESLTFIIDKFQKGVIPYIDTVMLSKKIDLGVFLIFDRSLKPWIFIAIKPNWSLVMAISDPVWTNCSKANLINFRMRGSVEMIFLSFNKQPP